MEHDRSVIGGETLDPQDWESMRTLGHRMIDDMVAALAACSGPGPGLL